METTNKISSLYNLQEKDSEKLKAISTFPSHVAIIMDGNRRWSNKTLYRVDSPSFGHEQGYVTLYNLVCFTAKIDQIKTLTVFAFSTENWKRSKKELDNLFTLSLKIFTENKNNPNLDGIRIRVLGSREGLSEELLQAMDSIEKTTEHFERMTLVIAFNYGGHWDLLEGSRRLLDSGAHQCQERSLEHFLPSSFLPPVDLLIRTGGEKRLSNFLLWQIAYAELLFLDTLWPDFTPSDFIQALEFFSQRVRRFGADSSHILSVNSDH